VHQTSLLDEELDLILPLLDSLRAQHDDIEDPQLIEQAALLAHALPREIRSFIEEFRLAEPSAVCVLSGLPVEDGEIGPTPANWNLATGRTPAFRAELFFLLCASLLGDVFAWRTKQDGRIMQNVLPAGPVESDHGDAGRKMPLPWRTEDARSPFRADYIAFMCLRNPDDIATTVCDTDWVDMSRIDCDPLFEAEYLYGDRDRPYLAIDPGLTLPASMGPPARAAYDDLTRAIDVALSGLVLWPGDIAFIDNRRAVHGQEEFAARYDGTDRWLKRLEISRNLRASRSRRSSSAGRVIR